MLLGGCLLTRWGIVATYRVSAALAAAALLLALGVDETLPASRRRPFSLRAASSPLGFLRLFRAGRTVGVLACVLGLQAVHDAEGDCWQLFAERTRGWGTRQNSLYGAMVGTCSTAGGEGWGRGWGLVRGGIGG